MLMEDKRAEKILTRTFWGSGGWKPDPDWPVPTDRSHAETAGYMFEDVDLHHDELVSRTITLAKQFELCDASDAFVASLTTRRRFLRPFLPSLVVARKLPPHGFTPDDDEIARCRVCGLYDVMAEVDRNVLNFERHHWGGVRLDDLGFVWFCLDRLAAEGTCPPTDEDVDALRRVLLWTAALEPRTTLTKAESALRFLPSNKDERLTILEILAMVDVLQDPDHPGFLDRFVPSVERSLPDQHFTDRGYPGAWWTASHGVNEDAVQAMFPQL